MKTKTPTCVPVRHIELNWAGDDIIGAGARSWRVNTFSEATDTLRKIAADIDYHGGDRDTAGLVATLLTFKVSYENGIEQAGMTRVRYQSKPDFLDCL
jgi:hypothetical protein